MYKVISETLYWILARKNLQCKCQRLTFQLHQYRPRINRHLLAAFDGFAWLHYPSHVLPGKVRREENGVEHTCLNVNNLAWSIPKQQKDYLGNGCIRRRVCSNTTTLPWSRASWIIGRFCNKRTTCLSGRRSDPRRTLWVRLAGMGYTLWQRLATTGRTHSAPCPVAPDTGRRW